MSELRKTALHSRHRTLGAKMTDFHGWDMPLYYTSILDEHRAVRQAVGVFDIAHMGQVLVNGPDACGFLDSIVTSDITQVGIGRACYTLLLNDDGGILDDWIIYRLGTTSYLVIVNCGNRDSDVAWMRQQARGRVTIDDISTGRSILAVQGPAAAHLLEQILDAKVAGLARFEIAPIRTMSPQSCISRTGYTGSDGFELFLEDRHAIRIWDILMNTAATSGIMPVGLGARDTLRIEAGLRLYGTDIDTETHPFEAGLGWTVAMNKAAFIGKDKLALLSKAPMKRRFIGFELAQGPIPRLGMPLWNQEHQQVGKVTSGTFSPILNKSLGMGYVEANAAAAGTLLALNVRNQWHAASVVKLPFWKEKPKPVKLVESLTMEHNTDADTG
ncbi:MAG: glycine cleavage system aminomethyltransferase GcvT [Candidatus Omnitrophica bacterium]|nr:glycine cleavage system aminomethyltransferase GcvT [Candidatus Omnitrophota bacterium]